MTPEEIYVVVDYLTEYDLAGFNFWPAIEQAAFARDLLERLENAKQ